MAGLQRANVVFARFWYDFIVGDDWMVPAAVGAALVVTAALSRAGYVSWWVLPLTVVVITGVSLRRAGSR